MIVLLSICIIGMPLIYLGRYFYQNKKTMLSVLSFALVLVLLLVINIGGIYLYQSKACPNNVQITTQNYDLLESDDGELLSINGDEVTCYVDEERHVVCENGILTFSDKDMKIILSEEEDIPRLVLKETVYTYKLWETILFGMGKETVESKATIYLPR